MAWYIDVDCTLNLLQSHGCEWSGAFCCIRWRVSTRSTLTARWCRPWSGSSTPLSPASTSTSPETGKSGSSTPLSPPSASVDAEAGKSGSSTGKTGKSGSSTPLSPPSTSTSPETGKSSSSAPLSPPSASTSTSTKLWQYFLFTGIKIKQTYKESFTHPVADSGSDTKFQFRLCSLLEHNATVVASRMALLFTRSITKPLLLWSKHKRFRRTLYTRTKLNMLCRQMLLQREDQPRAAVMPDHAVPRPEGAERGRCPHPASPDGGGAPAHASQRQTDR